MNDIYNIHSHIFTGKCAPKDFLQVAAKLGDGASTFLKWLILTRPISWLITKLGNLIPKRILQFLKIGVMASQKEVFLDLKGAYDNSEYSGIKIVALTIDMDYMSDPNKKPEKDFNSQIQDIYKLKKEYPNDLFPFYGIDPRNPDIKNLENLKKAIESKTFVGIKLYPANGFFPFDARLDSLYQYAEKNNIPVMTHCTRGGSYYLGKNVWSVIPDDPTSVNPSHPLMLEIRNRISKYKNASDKSFRENARACNLFSHPENYIPVLDKYPKLKLCIAHMGGDIEILGVKNPDAKSAKLYQAAKNLEGNLTSWYDIIKQKILIEKYPNAFTDISYSLCDENCMIQLSSDLKNGLILPERVLFGTDYFMVAKENAELKVVAVGQKNLSGYFPQFMSDNNKRYLF
ncbi:Predicted metal-dependent hydrolase, TIM-barrel fold [Flavobacterium sp. CF108]|uniref:amidohydrolase family protein n=1 Tax=unclassified Flavobacterium TaxID=196869 RepID=UPI0008C48D56|nr:MULTISPECIES: amidohydrolase family protein [unclassified Flavobacterium]SEO01555.1 Predicted metal-dependent hydrolase, TIM-barrel fold [Flavobacterium sp. fv08]SHH36510.1 Predicted metal-dependent hydrolase, TIM-barrel fold [Flavobacterium sp. CF108]